MSNPQGADENTVAEAVAWVVKSGAAAFGPEERRALARWRAQSPSHEAAYRDALATWEQSRLLGAADVTDEDAPPAAAMLLLLAAGVFVYAYDPFVALRADYATVAGETEQIGLADGSEIVLNTRSAVQIKFRDNQRVVTLLKGEAIFSVAPDASRPFIVDADVVDVRALGTRFVVREHRGVAKVTALAHAIEVAVATKDGAKVRNIVLRPVQSVQVRDDGTVSALTEEDPAHVAAWTRGRLVFRKRRLVDVLDEIDRQTGGRTIVMNDDLVQQTVSGVFFLDRLDGARRRIAGFDNRRDSFYFNTTNRRDEDDLEQQGARIKAKLSPTEDIDAVLTFERIEQNLPGPALTPADDVDSHDTATDVIGFNDRNATRVNLKADWRVADWLNLRSITGYNEPDGESFIDGDSSAVVNLSVGVNFDATQLSQELLFSSPRPLFDRFDWTIGATYFRDRIDTVQNNNLLAGAFAGSVVETTVGGDIDAYAVFGEGTFAITEKLKATASLRYTHEIKDVSVRQAVFGPLAGVLPPAATIEEKDRYNRVKPAGSLSYEWTEDFVTYAKVATAYKSGGVNFGATPSENEATFDPEDAISYEIGARTQWFDKRLQLNATLFHQEQSDLQIRVRDVGAGLNFFDNVGDAETQGVEVSARAEPVDGLTILANYGYLNARFEDAAVQSGGANVDVSGNRIPDVPVHTFNIGARYTFAITDWLDAFARVDHYMTRGGFADAENQFDLDYKDLTNLAVGVEGDHFAAQVFVENLFDNAYFEFSPTAAGLGQRNAPRVWGITVTARW